MCEYDKEAITRIWKILGIETYEQAQGKSVDELVADLQAELQQAKEANGRLKEATNWLLEEYHFLSRKMTVINNVVGGLWGELRERRNNYQLIEKFIEQVQKEGLEEALKDKPDA